MSYTLSLLLILQLLLITQGQFIFSTSFAILLLFSIWITLVFHLLFQYLNPWASKFSTVIVYFFISFVLLELGHWSIYGLAPTPAIYIAIFDTHWSEVVEFVQSHELSKFGIILTIAGILVFVISRIKVKVPRKVILTFVITAFLPLVSSNQSIWHNSFLRVIPNYLVYAKEIKSFNRRLQSFKKMKLDVKSHDKQRSKVVVLILGEAITRNRMSLFGYNRETTPLLSKDTDLIAFQNISSPHTQTFQSLRKVLTLMNSKNEKSLKENLHLIDLAKLAGHKTYWISNQRSLGWFENAQSRIAFDAHEKYWVNSALGIENKIHHDETILPPLERVLAQKKDSKFIVIHLMGAHAHYKNRYPSSFSKFKGPMRNHQMSLNAKEWDLYNAYDNAILYQDHVISKIVAKVRKASTHYSVVFFPDHGEEAYQTLKYAGHSEVRMTPNMIQIPFLLWTSDKNLKERAVRALDREWNTEDFIHSLHTLLGISSSVYDERLDLLGDGLI